MLRHTVPYYSTAGAMYQNSSDEMINDKAPAGQTAQLTQATFFPCRCCACRALTAEKIHSCFQTRHQENPPIFPSTGRKQTIVL